MPGLQNVDISVTVPSVDSWFNTMNGYAHSAIASANNAANALLHFSPPTFSSNVTFKSISTPVTIGSVPKPIAPSISLGTRNLPSAPSIDNPVITLGAAPVFSEADPSVNLPAVPSPLDISLPVKDFIINTNFDYPVTPDTTLPSVPSLLSLNLPNPEVVTLPTFDLNFPTSNSLVPPGVTFTFIEDLYNSTLLNGIKQELLNRISGGSGINTVVEEAIWSRGKDREIRASVLAERSVLVDRVSQGFSRPPGSVQSAIDQIALETQSKIIELSREVMIKQAELEQENIKSSIQQSIALEDMLLRDHQTIVQRSFEVAKYIQDLAIEIFKTKVSVYTSEVEAYRAFATAYTSRVQAELSKIEIFKAQIEAEKLKGDLNEQNIRLYLARIEGVKNNVEIYKALISTVSEKLQAEQIKLEVYKTDISAYSEAARAKASEFSIYSEQIKGELAKVEVFDSKVKAFSSRIQAYAATSDVTIKQAEIAKDIEQLKITKYQSDIDAFIKQVQADQLIYQSAVDLYKGETQLYLGDVELGKASAELALKSADNTIEQNKASANVSLENAKITLESVKGAYGAILQAKTNAGSIYQAIGTSALSAINVSAQVSGQAQISASESHNYTDQ